MVPTPPGDSTCCLDARAAFSVFTISSSFLGAAGALFSFGALAATTVKIGTVVWIGYGPYYVADQLDLYKKSGVKVALQIFNDPALIPPRSPVVR